MIFLYVNRTNQSIEYWYILCDNSFLTSGHGTREARWVAGVGSLVVDRWWWVGIGSGSPMAVAGGGTPAAELID